MPHTNGEIFFFLGLTLFVPRCEQNQHINRLKTLNPDSPPLIELQKGTCGIQRAPVPAYNLTMNQRYVSNFDIFLSVPCCIALNFSEPSKTSSSACLWHVSACAVQKRNFHDTDISLHGYGQCHTRSWQFLQATNSTWHLRERICAFTSHPNFHIIDIAVVHSIVTRLEAFDVLLVKAKTKARKQTKSGMIRVKVYIWSSRVPQRWYGQR